MPTFSADDANLFCTGQNPDDMLQEINIEMENLFQGESKSHYAEKKAKFMLFTAMHFSRSMGNIYMNGTCIIEVTETKFLGAIIDYDLNWSHNAHQ